MLVLLFIFPIGDDTFSATERSERQQSKVRARMNQRKQTQKATPAQYRTDNAGPPVRNPRQVQMQFDPVTGAGHPSRSNVPPVSSHADALDYARDLPRNLSG